MNTNNLLSRRRSRVRYEDRPEYSNQGTYKVEVNLTPEEVIEMARQHFPEENGIQEASSSEDCISFTKPGKPWIGDQVQVFACPTDQEEKTEVIVQHHHRGRAVKKFLDKLN